MLGAVYFQRHLRRTARQNASNGFDCQTRTMTFQQALQLPKLTTVRCAGGKDGILMVLHRRPETFGVSIPGEWMLRSVPVARLQLHADGTCQEIP
jgi:hypothetical protein